MDSRAVAGLLLLTAATACGARTALRSDDNGADDDGAAGSVNSSCSAPSCTPIDAMATVSSLIAEGERIYYVVHEGRVMSADADTGATTLLAQIPAQPLNAPIALALDADSLYVTFAPEDAISMPGARNCFSVSTCPRSPLQAPLVRPHLPALLALALASACHPSGAASPSSDDPRWLVLRVDAVNVAPTRAGTSSPWDIPAPQSSDGAECGLLGIAGSLLFSPIAGKGAEYLCSIGSRPRQQEQDPSAPDLVVGLGAGAATNYQTYTARDSFYHIFRSEFVVPTDAIPPEGLLLTVFDRDGGQSEVIGAVRLDRAQLVGAARSTPLLTLGDPRGGLTRLELVVSAHNGLSEVLSMPMDIRAGTMAPNFRPIRAGEIVDVVATGQYKIGGFLHPKWIDPRGYPDGEARGYNFENEPFHSAPHGSGLAIVGTGDAKVGQSVAPCASFVSRVSGPLVLGINDSDPKNDEGSAQFSVRASPPSAAEWLTAQTTSCPAR